MAKRFVNISSSVLHIVPTEMHLRQSRCCPWRRFARKAGKIFLNWAACAASSIGRRRKADSCAKPRARSAALAKVTTLASRMCGQRMPHEGSGTSKGVCRLRRS